MSAAIFGASLLEDVHEESLDQLLAELRHGLNPESQGLLGLPELDRFLDLFRLHNSTGHHDGDTSDHDNDLTSFNASFNHRKPTLIEITNTTSSPGKTNLLYLLTSLSILPTTHTGHEATVIWLDTDNTFSAWRLYQICLNHLTTLANPPSNSTAQTIVEEALRHVHVFSLSSSAQLLSVLDDLPDYLFQTVPSSNDGSVSETRHHSQHRPLGLIVLDSATAFYWPDRFDTEIARLEAVTTSHPATSTSITTQPSSTSQIIAKLTSLCATFSSVCIYTTNPPPIPTSIPSASRTQNTPTQRPAPPTATPLSPWTQAATLSLTLTRIPVPLFASHMSLSNCIRDREKRQEVVSRQRVRVLLCEEWVAGVVPGLLGMRRREVRELLAENQGEGFVIRVNGEGVGVE